jgi:hypothetical protein
MFHHSHLWLNDLCYSGLKSYVYTLSSIQDKTGLQATIYDFRAEHNTCESLETPFVVLDTGLN